MCPSPFLGYSVQRAARGSHVESVDSHEAVAPVSTRAPEEPLPREAWTSLALPPTSSLPGFFLDLVPGAPVALGRGERGFILAVWSRVQ